MSERRKVEERIRKKEQEIQVLESQVREAKIYIQALQDVMKMFPKDSLGDEPVTVMREGSAVAQARDVILKAGKPLHISIIIQQLGKESSRSARISLASSLAAYVRKGEIFTRPAPNTFGLTEMGHVPNLRPPMPPDDFAQDQDPISDEDKGLAD